MAARTRWKTHYPEPDEVRMTLGEHLEELRTRLIRAIIGLAVGAVVCFAFSNYVMGFLCAPVLAVLKAQGYPPELGYFNPAEAFITDLKVAVLVGLILTAPYSLVQLWGFVAAGLYSHERRWVHRFAPVSIGLFYLGAGFLLTMVSPLLLKFLLTYRTELPDLQGWIPNVVLPAGQGGLKTDADLASDKQGGDENQGAAPALPSVLPSPIPTFQGDPPEHWPEGTVWIDKEEWQLRVRYGETVYRVAHLIETNEKPRLRPDIRITEYIMFVLHLAAAFGVGFQVPVVVAFVATVGIATAAEMGKLRKYVWLGMAVGAAFITPPDIGSMLALLGPMALLYEVGLIAARFLERERERENSET